MARAQVSSRKVSLPKNTSAPTQRFTESKQFSDIKISRPNREIYRLVNGTENSFQIIKTSHINAIRGYDENTKRTIYGFMRLCDNQSSIWEDEQHEPFSRYRLIVEGELIVDTTDLQGQLTAEFLDRSPENVENGGSLFRKIDVEKIATQDVEDEEAVIDVKAKIKAMSLTEDGKEELRHAGRALRLNAAAENPDINVLKGQLFKYIGNSASKAKQVLGAMDDKVSRLLSLIDKCYEKGELEYRNQQVRWTGAEEPIIVIPLGKDWKQHLAAFASTLDQVELFRELERVSR